MNLQEGLVLLTATCQKTGIRLILEYDTGVFVDMKNPQFVQQGPKGWRIEVDHKVHVDKDRIEILYPDIANAIAAGLQMIKTTLEERKNAT